MPVERYTFTLIRRGNTVIAVTPGVAVRATPVPLTANSELRVSAEVRRVSSELCETHDSLEPVEALCTVESSGQPEEIRPGVVLLDNRFPIWLVVFDDEVFVSVDTELAEGRAQRRFVAVSHYVRFLADRGYTAVFDHRIQRLIDDGGSATAIVEQFARAGSSRLFDQLRTDRRFGFIGSVVGVALADAALQFGTHTTRPLWATALYALAVGGVVTALQHQQARRLLTERLEQLRSEVLTGIGPAERLTFRRPRRDLWSEIFAVVVFGSFATIGIFSNVPLVAAFLTTMFIVACVSLALRRQVRVDWDSQGVEGLSTTGRARVAYRDIDRIVERSFPRLTVVVSARDIIWVPAGLEHYRQLVDELWRRADCTCRATEPESRLVTDEAVESFRHLLRTARTRSAFGWRAWPAKWKPLWLLVFARNHPLRPQFAWHRHLLRRGRLTFALVIDADPALAHPQRETDAHDGFAVVLFATEASGAATSEVLESIAARIVSLDSRREAAEMSEYVARFLQQLDDAWPFPLLVEVPRELTGGQLVYCTSVLVVLRHIPLGHLRSPWVPLLSDPCECEHVMIPPLGLWDSSWRRQWKTEVASDAHLDASSTSP